jgi:RteC protein
MRTKSEILYQSFIRDIERCSSGFIQPAVHTECCLRLSTHYWQQLRDMLRHHLFTDISEEIHFFKVIKPSFLVESEYYGLIAYSLQFCPRKRREKQEFWKQQQRRLEIFKSKYAVFYQYHAAGKTDLDAAYYTAGNPDSKGYQYDRAESGYDLLLAQLAARERYAAYAKSNWFAL